VTRPESARAARHLVRPPRRGILGLLFVLAACGSPVPEPSDGGQQTPTPSPAAQDTCDPESPLVLFGPDGTQVQLGSGAGGTSTWLGDDGLTYYLRQSGDCVWITGVLPAERVGGQDPVLTSFFGRLDPGFAIIGQFADITGVLIRGYDRGSWVYEVTFDEGDVVLVEDRSGGEPPGCEGGDGACPDPRRLRRLEDLLVASEDFDPPFTVALPPDWQRDGDIFFMGEHEVAIEVHRDPVIMSAGCDLQPEPGVGPGAAGIVAALTSRDGLAISGPEPISVGGLSGRIFDFSLDPAWTGGCPWTFGSPTVPVEGSFDASGANTGFTAVEPGETWRYIVLDAPDGGSVVIWMLASESAGQVELDAAMPVVDSIEFDLAG
jgi:hypothetical protein